MSTDSHPKLAQTACTRCREQKLRCSRQLPQCSRCLKVNVSCSFPEPPDRRLIAVRRESRKRQVASTDPVDGDDAQPAKRCRTMEWPPISHLPQHEEQKRSLADEDATQSLASLDQETHRILQDTYFSCMFNSSLTFHRPTFERDYVEGSVPECVLQAMYAIAACLVPESPSTGHKHNGAEAQSLEDLKASSLPWAIQAGRTALQNIDQPTLPAVQTCQILAMFWFSHGDYRRNDMFAGIAYRAARCMVQDTFLDQDGDEEEERGHPRWLECEQVRRCFWSSWQMRCINSDQYAVGSSTGPQIMALLLPASERAFMQGKWEECAGTFASRSVQAMPSANAEFMRLVLLWARVRDYIDARRSKNSSNSEAWSTAFTLYDELAQLKKQLHPSLAYSKRNLYDLLVVQQQSVCILLYALYHQCCLVLQASMVPSLSGSLRQDKTPPQAVRVSAEIALEHAEALSGLAADLLALDWEPARIAPFVGYSMYVAAAVHLTVMGRESSKVESSRRHLAACLQLLKNMKPYWKILEQLWDRLQLLYELQMPKTSDQSSKQASDLEVDARNINEVLNDSVLYFSLRRLQPRASSSQKASPDNKKTSPSSSSPLDEVLKQSSQEQVPDILECDNNMTLQTEVPGFSIPNSGDEFDFLQPPTTTTTTGGFENWWAWDMGADVQAGVGQLSFDDLFGMDLTFQ